MSLIVVLDSGPLGLATNPKRSPHNLACNQWLQALLAKNSRIIIPEIADYEVRRELLRAQKTKGLRRLNQLNEIGDYLPLTTAMMQDAAQMWATARQNGQPTADKHALDGDVILAAQVHALGKDNIVVATTNVKHLSRFVNAAMWSDIS